MRKTTYEQRIDIARAIFFFEARLDSKGRIRVYELPAGDGGGAREVAGFNSKYHPEELSMLSRLIQAGKHEEAQTAAINFIARYTDAAGKWTNVTALEAFLRDTIFNRGASGAAKILQMALGDVKVDGKVGPLTRASLEAREPEVMLVCLRSSREKYERVVVRRNERSKFWKGLVNRWDDAYQMAAMFFDRGRV